MNEPPDLALTSHDYRALENSSRSHGWRPKPTTREKDSISALLTLNLIEKLPEGLIFITLGGVRALSRRLATENGSTYEQECWNLLQRRTTQEISRLLAPPGPRVQKNLD